MKQIPWDIPYEISQLGEIWPVCRENLTIDYCFFGLATNRTRPAYIMASSYTVLFLSSDRAKACPKICSAPKQR